MPYYEVDGSNKIVSAARWPHAKMIELADDDVRVVAWKAERAAGKSDEKVVEERGTNDPFMKAIVAELAAQKGVTPAQMLASLKTRVKG